MLNCYNDYSEIYSMSMVSEIEKPMVLEGLYKIDGTELMQFYPLLKKGSVRLV